MWLGFRKDNMPPLKDSLKKKKPDLKRDIFGTFTSSIHID